MKKFTFKFQSILKLKEMEEMYLEEEYLVFRKAYQDTVERVNRLVSEKDEQINSLEATEGEGLIDLNNALLYRDYLTHLRQEITLGRVEESQKKSEMDAGLNRLVEKTRERKTFEKLKEKQQEKFSSEQLRNMQNELDDLAQGRFIYQQNS